MYSHELSEMYCSDDNCGKIKQIVGAVFKDEHCSQDMRSSKSNKHDTSRHYKFWIDRLQALEDKVFDEKILTKIQYVLNRDRYDVKTLTCKNMRAILKDSKVAATSLNDHVPLLVKTFGGPAPPQFTFEENKLIASKFSKIMKLYEKVNPNGGNKRYYPYFIYKIVEREFSNKPDKLRILNYIHLQSRDTVIKNDKYYKQICNIADKSDGFVYKPTDPCGRI